MLGTAQPGINSHALEPEQALSLAHAMLGRNQFADAEKLCRAVAASKPEWAEPLNLLAVVLVHQDGAVDEVIELLQRAVDLEPRHIDAWSNLGNVLKMRDRIDDAIKAYRKALALDAKDAGTHNNLGLAYAEKRDYIKAAKCFREAIRIQPGLVQAHFNLGRVLCQQKKIDPAIAAFCKVITIKPDFTPVYRPYGMLLYSLNRKEEAIELYKNWLIHCPDDPVAQHMLAACSGEAVPERASDAYVKTLFDQHSINFDDNLGKLDYRAPQLVAEQVRKLGRTELDMLDAGCGTGLCGPLVKAECKTMTGIDLSPGMLKKAGWRGIYDVLEEAELTDYLIRHPQSWGLIISADTLCYFGSIDEFSLAAFNALHAKGVLIFTVELLISPEPGQNYRLGESGRYAHTSDYVSKALLTAGFSLNVIEQADLRKEGGKPVVGLVIVASRT